ncbi:hypothetical protein TI04_06310 [Achromatium sp. WMS2]|nr:hypothetical protein TI04_06310 [Achromatium sp. WMS2]
MPAKDKFNAAVMKLQHEMWKNKLITFLNGGPAPTNTSHKDCALGKWMYQEGGMSEYGTLPEMKSLERQHTQFHDTVRKAIDLHSAGDQDAAWKLYESLKPMSAEIMRIIDVFNTKINR